jgi:translocation and assembly module TamB
MDRIWNTTVGRVAIIAASLAAGFVLLIVVLFRTAPGHAAVGWIVTQATGGDVVIDGLSGNLPGNLRAKSVVVRDRQGVWLRAEGVAIDWKPSALLDNHVEITHGRIGYVAILRRHISKAKNTSESPTRIEANDVVIDRVELAEPVVGRRAALSASGSFDYTSLHDVSADLDVRQLDGAGRYRVNASIRHDIADGFIVVEESGAGFAGGLIGMPDIGPVSLDARAYVRGRADIVAIRLQAGQLHAVANGTIDLVGRSSAIDFTVAAPAMHPTASLSWVSMAAEGHLRGTFHRPILNATLKIDGVSASGFAAHAIIAELQGSGGGADLKATAENLRIPGGKPDVFSGAPVTMTAHVNLAAPSHPVTFLIDHPLLRIKGLGGTRPLDGTMSIIAPSLGPLVALAGIDLDGSGRFDVKFSRDSNRTALTMAGRIAAKGRSVPSKLLGANASVEAGAGIDPSGNLVLHGSIKGAAFRAHLDGHSINGVYDAQGDVTVSDISRAVSQLTGKVALRGRWSGRTDDLHMAVNGDASVATKGFPAEKLSIAAAADGLPKLRRGYLKLAGRFDGAPVTLDGTITGAGNKAFAVKLTKASWKSVRAQASVLISDSEPRGGAALQIANLADLSPLFGAPLKGSLGAKADFTPGPHPAVALSVGAQDVQASGTSVAKLNLNGSISDPFGRPTFKLSLNAPQFAARNISGSAQGQLAGPLDNMSITLSSDVATASGQTFTLAANGTLDLPGEYINVRNFQGVWRDQTVTLATPADLAFNGKTLSFDASFLDGKSARLALKGSVPLRSGQPMNLHAIGWGDMGGLAAGLAAVGQTVAGKLTVDFTVTGPLAQPRVVGQARFSEGMLQDYAHGISLHGIDAVVDARGSLLRLTRFTAQASQGTITGNGTIDLAAPGVPVDVAFKATNARPFASDLVTATLDADLKLQGKLNEHVGLSGDLRLTHSEITIPKKFPPDVATLDVRHAGTHPSPPSRRSLFGTMGLDVTVSSPGQVFVRGRGLEAEFEGRLKITGTTASPQVQGALNMRRGTLSLAGSTLDFQSGRIGFNGSSLRERLDPSLDFTAESTSDGITATLKVTDTASAPKVDLSSTPSLPQDEILAQLLFHQSVKQLSPLQLAQIGQAVASLGGVGSGFDPVGVMRKSLGLDKLALGSAQSAGGAPGQTTVEAGKYVLRNVYLGAQQSLSGGTRVLVQMDVTKHLKAQATVTTGSLATTSTSTPLQDNGDTIGLTYQFEY